MWGGTAGGPERRKERGGGEDRREASVHHARGRERDSRVLQGGQGGSIGCTVRDCGCPPLPGALSGHSVGVWPLLPSGSHHSPERTEDLPDALQREPVPCRMNERVQERMVVPLEQRGLCVLCAGQRGRGQGAGTGRVSRCPGGCIGGHAPAAVASPSPVQAWGGGGRDSCPACPHPARPIMEVGTGPSGGTRVCCCVGAQARSSAGRRKLGQARPPGSRLSSVPAGAGGPPPATLPSCLPNPRPQFPARPT